MGSASLESAVHAPRHGTIGVRAKPVVGGAVGELRRKAGGCGLLIGASPPMQRVYELIDRVATTDAGVLISGETGTGKELVAQAIHGLSRRRSQAFLPLNCGAVSATLIESEIFGHERGSFTGAERAHRGYFERAHRGTLFLDEIGTMPSDLQVRLLRVLETAVVDRVGSTETIKVDVRIVAATNQPPEEAVAAGRLRLDLFYRLNVFPMTLPPLRERGDDVLLLAEHFLADLNTAEGTARELTGGCLERLRRHPWPGNVRELRNVVHRAFILAERSGAVDCLPLPRLRNVGGVPALASEDVDASSLVIRLGTTLAETERRLILATIDHFSGHKDEAAQALGMGVNTLYNRLREYKACDRPLPTGPRAS